MTFDPLTFDDLFALTPAIDRSSDRCTDHWTAPGAPPTDERCVFGGLVVGQAIVAVSEGTRRCHAIHAFFIGMGAKQEAFEIAVDRMRDGGSFATRRVEVRQGERLLLAALSSHHDGDDGPEHQIAMPVVTGPEGIEDYAITRAALAAAAGKPLKQFIAEQMLEMRPATLPNSTDGAAEAIWFRPRKPVQGAQSIQQAVVGFASDVGLVRAGLQRNDPATRGPLQTASLDHSLWFHREIDANEWMLYVLSSPVARNGRGLSHASVFSRDGQLVASVAQEFLARTQRA